MQKMFQLRSNNIGMHARHLTPCWLEATRFVLPATLHPRAAVVRPVKISPRCNWGHSWCGAALGLAGFIAAQSPSNKSVRAETAEGGGCGEEALKRELSRIVQGTTGTVGLAVTALTGGASSATIGLNSGELFPMASTFKVPMACVVLRLVDEGKLRLTEEIQLSVSDVRPGTGVLTMKLLSNQDGMSAENKYTVYQLLETAMNDSDNTATDVLLRRIGGPSAVTHYIRSLGLPDMTVTRGCLEHLRDRCGIRPETTPAALLLCEPGSPKPDAQEMVEFVAMLEGRMEVLPLASLAAVDAAFDADPRDQTTPEDMLRLLQMIWNREAQLSEQSTQVLLDIMAHCRTGKARIPGRLPAYVMEKGFVIHKTGSLGGRSNNVGFIQLPDGKGAVAIAAYVKGPPSPGQNTTAQMYAERDRIIADVARACYDFFLFRN
eukprot:TRINITY_DN91270_c0_g1_i1.p1 TRINITY_DN91270_c0_g1~~TRINITY_DN91270_c0_g1_i1.p1  ORF type:complete len:434 (-),score=72.89 TRINITY_DN91270_c0_g1_i1:53-1354(-)